MGLDAIVAGIEMGFHVLLVLLGVVPIVAFVSLFREPLN